MSHALVVYVQEEILSSSYWRGQRAPIDLLDKYDPNKPNYEHYRVDHENFESMFMGVSPWASGTESSALALKAFRVSCSLLCKSKMLF